MGAETRERFIHQPAHLMGEPLPQERSPGLRRQGYNIYDWQVARLDLNGGEAVRLTGSEKPERLKANSPTALLPPPDGTPQRPARLPLMAWYRQYNI